MVAATARSMRTETGPDGWIDRRRLAARGFGQEDGCSDLVGWRWIGRDPEEDAGESAGGG